MSAELQRVITDADVKLAENWRALAVAVDLMAREPGTNEWAARCLKQASRYLSQAAAQQDHAEGIKRRNASPATAPDASLSPATGRE